MVDSEDEYPKGWKLILTISSLFLGTLVVAIDTIIISVAIPAISTEFQTLNDIGWYGSAYLLTLTALQPTLGVIYKHFHMKNVYIISIVLFEVGSTICASAPTSEALIVGRAVAGIGAAGLLQGALSIITISAPLEKRPLYIGLVVSAYGICSCSAPIIGGALTQTTTWRWCFWINLPIGALVFFLVILGLKIRSGVECEAARQLPLKKKLLRLDPAGTAFFICSMCCLFLALQWAGIRYEWNSPTIIGLLIAFAVLLAFFIITQWWAGARAMIPLHVLGQRTVAFGALTLFFIGMSNNVRLYFLPFYFQAVQATSIIESGIRFLSLAVPEIVAGVVAGALATATGFYVPIILAGEVICSIGTALLTTLNLSTSTILWATYMALSGLGNGLCVNMPYIAIQAILKSPSDVYAGNAIATFATLAGGAVAISIAQSIFTNRLTSSVNVLAPAIPPQSVIQNGALELQRLTNDPQILLALRESYGQAVVSTMIFSTVSSCVSIFASLGLQWLNLKTVTKSGVGDGDREEVVVLDDKSPKNRHTCSEAGDFSPSLMLKHRSGVVG